MSAGKPSTVTEKPTWWCNFCNFKTQDQAVYLKHSCAEELKKQGQSPQAGDGRHCG
jgi:hypothetical protein